MAKHLKYVCQHGTTIRQCRCPGDKSVRMVDCEGTCKVGSEQKAQPTQEGNADGV